MNYKGVLLAVFAIIILISGILISCSSSPGNTDSNNSGVDEFEVIRQAADDYLNSGKASVTILAKDLYALLTDGNKTNDPYILSIRRNSNDQLGHICGAIRLPWRTLFMEEWFAQLPPKNQKMVIYDYNGHNGGKAAAILNMMGWDVTNLQWGFTSWMECPNAAPGLFRPSTIGGVGQDFIVDKKENKTTNEYTLPVVKNSNSSDKLEIIRAAADVWRRNEVLTPEEFTGIQVPDITAQELLTLLNDPYAENDPFILDVREPDWYAKGHVPGAINIPLKQVAKVENLRKLPTDRKVVVVSNDGMLGSQVMGILSILGYNADNLLFGMTSWTRKDDIAPGRFYDRDYPDKGIKKDIMDLKICWGDEPGSY